MWLTRIKNISCHLPTVIRLVSSIIWYGIQQEYGHREQRVEDLKLRLNYSPPVSR